MKAVSKGYARFDVFTEEQRETVKKQLLKGAKIKEVAEVTQKEWGLFKDVEQGSLIKQLQRWRDHVLKVEVVQRVHDTLSSMTSRQLAKKLNARDELERVIEIQWARFSKLYGREQQGALLFKQASDELRLLKDMVVEFGKLQVETGELPRAPKSVNGEFVLDGKTVKFSWSEEHDKLLHELDGVIYEESN